MLHGTPCFNYGSRFNTGYESELYTLQGIE
jgi:hypothetical protein